MTTDINGPEGSAGDVRSDASDLLNIPAIAEMAAFGPRFCLWRQEVRDGKPTKVPLKKNGAKAQSNNPSTWCTHGQAVAALNKLRAEGARIDGIGVFLGRLEDGRFLVGLDLDLCRSPVTGAIEPWA